MTRKYGPWLVALGAALWGTESAWRIPLNQVFDADVLVFYEHVLLVAMFLPVLAMRVPELRKIGPQTVGYLAFSGIAGSAVGTILYTEALARGNATVVNVVLNIQPVLSTTAAVFLFKDRLAPRFFLWAPIAVVAGGVLSIDKFSALGAGGGLDAGTGLALLCALFWGLSTVAGRGVMMRMSLPLASAMRVVFGLATTFAIVVARGKLSAATLWPAAAQAAPLRTGLFLFLLASLSGGLPLVIYFAGLQRTRASTAGYSEMMQTVTAAFITWVFFHEALAPHQIAAALVLIGAVALVQREQSTIDAAPSP
jgi:drug/metabolite transporter (DMT)-like permease